MNAKKLTSTLDLLYDLRDEVLALMDGIEERWPMDGEMLAGELAGARDDIGAAAVALMVAYDGQVALDWPRLKARQAPERLAPRGQADIVYRLIELSRQLETVAHEVYDHSESGLEAQGKLINASCSTAASLGFVVGHVSRQGKIEITECNGEEAF